MSMLPSSNRQSSAGENYRHGMGWFGICSTWNRSRSWSENVSTTATSTTGHSSTYGQSEVLHKRYLMNPDEIGRFFAPVKNKLQPGYPGMMLILMRGSNPVAVKRTNYFEGSFFDGKYDRHPDHPYPPTLKERFESGLADLLSAFPMPKLITHIKPLTWLERLQAWFRKYRTVLILGWIATITLPLLLIKLFLDGGLSMVGLVVLYFLFGDTFI